METLVAVAHHKDHHQYYGSNRCHNGSTKFDFVGSAPTGNFAGITCRTFESGAGLLPTPTKSCSTPSTKKAFSDPFSPKTPSPVVNDIQKCLKRNCKSAFAIPVKINFENEGGFNYSERWAGPAYSNSPPPSSLPLPKFSMRPKRTVSLELPSSTYKIDFHSFAKSAPSSPTRERSPSPSDMFDSADFATKSLRRILNLDISDE